eukprot:jgi/Mesen1/10335/ME000008S10112
MQCGDMYSCSVRACKLEEGSQGWGQGGSESAGIIFGGGGEEEQQMKQEEREEEKEEEEEKHTTPPLGEDGTLDLLSVCASAPQESVEGGCGGNSCKCEQRDYEQGKCEQGEGRDGHDPAAADTGPPAARGATWHELPAAAAACSDKLPRLLLLDLNNAAPPADEDVMIVPSGAEAGAGATRGGFDVPGGEFGRGKTWGNIVNPSHTLPAVTDNGLNAEAMLAAMTTGHPSGQAMTSLTGGAMIGIPGGITRAARASLHVEKPPAGRSCQVDAVEGARVSWMGKGRFSLNSTAQVHLSSPDTASAAGCAAGPPSGSPVEQSRGELIAEVAGTQGPPLTGPPSPDASRLRGGERGRRKRKEQEGEQQQQEKQEGKEEEEKEEGKGEGGGGLFSRKKRLLQNRTGLPRGDTGGPTRGSSSPADVSAVPPLPRGGAGWLAKLQPKPLLLGYPRIAAWTITRVPSVVPMDRHLSSTYPLEAPGVSALKSSPSLRGAPGGVRRVPGGKPGITMRETSKVRVSGLAPSPGRREVAVLRERGGVGRICDLRRAVGEEAGRGAARESDVKSGCGEDAKRATATVRWAAVDGVLPRAATSEKAPRAPSGAADSKSDTLFLGKLCKAWSRSDVARQLARLELPGLVNFNLVMDHVTSRNMHRGFAFLGFEDHKAAAHAHQILLNANACFGLEAPPHVEWAKVSGRPKRGAAGFLRLPGTAASPPLRTPPQLAPLPPHTPQLLATAAGPLNLREVARGGASHSARTEARARPAPLGMRVDEEVCGVRGEGRRGRLDDPGRSGALPRSSPGDASAYALASASATVERHSADRGVGAAGEGAEKGASGAARKGASEGARGMRRFEKAAEEGAKEVAPEGVGRGAKGGVEEGGLWEGARVEGEGEERKRRMGDEARGGELEEVKRARVEQAGLESQERGVESARQREEASRRVRVLQLTRRVKVEEVEVEEEERERRKERGREREEREKDQDGKERGRGGQGVRKREGGGGREREGGQREEGLRGGEMERVRRAVEKESEGGPERGATYVDERRGEGQECKERRQGWGDARRVSKRVVGRVGAETGKEGAAAGKNAGREHAAASASLPGGELPPRQPEAGDKETDRPAGGEGDAPAGCVRRALNELIKGRLATAVLEPKTTTRAPTTTATPTAPDKCSPSGARVRVTRSAIHARISIFHNNNGDDASPLVREGRLSAAANGEEEVAAGEACGAARRSGVIGMWARMREEGGSGRCRERGGGEEMREGEGGGAEVRGGEGRWGERGRAGIRGGGGGAGAWEALHLAGLLHDMPGGRLRSSVSNGSRSGSGSGPGSDSENGCAMCHWESDSREDGVAHSARRAHALLKRLHCKEREREREREREGDGEGVGESPRKKKKAAPSPTSVLQSFAAQQGLELMYEVDGSGPFSCTASLAASESDGEPTAMGATGVAPDKGRVKQAAAWELLDKLLGVLPEESFLRKGKRVGEGDREAGWGVRSSPGEAYERAPPGNGRPLVERWAATAAAAVAAASGGEQHWMEGAAAGRGFSAMKTWEELEGDRLRGAEAPGVDEGRFDRPGDVARGSWDHEQGTDVLQAGPSFQVVLLRPEETYAERLLRIQSRQLARIQRVGAVSSPDGILPLPAVQPVQPAHPAAHPVDLENTYAKVSGLYLRGHVPVLVPTVPDTAALFCGKGGGALTRRDVVMLQSPQRAIESSSLASRRFKSRRFESSGPRLPYDAKEGVGALSAGAGGMPPPRSAPPGVSMRWCYTILDYSEGLCQGLP